MDSQLGPRRFLRGPSAERALGDFVRSATLRSSGRAPRRSGSEGHEGHVAKWAPRRRGGCVALGKRAADKGSVKDVAGFPSEGEGGGTFVRAPRDGAARRGYNWLDDYRIEATSGHLARR